MKQSAGPANLVWGSPSSWWCTGHLPMTSQRGNPVSLVTMWTPPCSPVTSVVSLDSRFRWDWWELDRANWWVIWRGAYIGPFSRPGNWANFPSLSCHLLCSDTFCQLFPPRSDLLPPFARELKVDLFAHAELKVFLCKVFPGSRSCLRLGIWARHRSRCCQQAALWLFSRIGHRLLYVGAPGNLDLYLNSFSISSLTMSFFLDIIPHNVLVSNNFSWIQDHL